MLESVRDGRGWGCIHEVMLESVRDGRGWGCIHEVMLISERWEGVGLHS